jgi:hypothetical protein
MTDNVRRITGPKPASLKPLSENDVARRVALQQTVAAMLPFEPKLVDGDDARLALLIERVGEVGAAYWRGHTDIDGELLKVWASVQAWLESRARIDAA